MGRWCRSRRRDGIRHLARHSSRRSANSWPHCGGSQPATKLVCSQLSKELLAVIHVHAYLAVGSRSIPCPAADQLTVGDIMGPFEPIHRFSSDLADDRARQLAQLDVRSGDLHPYLVRPAILQATRRNVDEGM